MYFTKYFLTIYLLTLTYCYGQQTNLEKVKSKQLVNIKSFGKSEEQVHNAYPKDTIIIRNCQLISMEVVDDSHLIMYSFYTGTAKTDSGCVYGKFINILDYSNLTENKYGLDVIENWNDRFNLKLSSANFILFNKFGIYLYYYTYKLTSGRVIGGEYYPCYFIREIDKN